MLRVEKLGVAGTETEELGIESIGIRDDRVRLHVARVRQETGIDPGFEKFLVGEERDRLHTVPQIAPERGRIRCTGKPACHADDGDVACGCRISGIRRFAGRLSRLGTRCLRADRQRLIANCRQLEHLDEAGDRIAEALFEQPMHPGETK